MNDADNERLKLFPTYESQLDRVEDLLVYATQDETQTLLPDGLLEDAKVILAYWAVGESLESQIDRLAKFIMNNVPGEPSQSQGAVDTAIRLLSAMRTKAEIESELERLEGFSSSQLLTKGWVAALKWVLKLEASDA